MMAEAAQCSAHAVHTVKTSGRSTLQPTGFTKPAAHAPYMQRSASTSWVGVTAGLFGETSTVEAGWKIQLVRASAGLQGLS